MESYSDIGRAIVNVELNIQNSFTHVTRTFYVECHVELLRSFGSPTIAHGHQLNSFETHAFEHTKQSNYQINVMLMSHYQKVFKDYKYHGGFEFFHQSICFS